MGNWIITIEGVGPHHNDKDYDADQIAKECLEELLKAGHSIKNATVSCGGWTEYNLVKD